MLCLLTVNYNGFQEKPFDISNIASLIQLTGVFVFVFVWAYELVNSGGKGEKGKMIYVHFATENHFKMHELKRYYVRPQSKDKKSSGSRSITIM